MKPLRGLLIIIVVLISAIAAPFLWLSGRMASNRTITGKRRQRKPPMPMTDADIADAEKQLGFALPEDLRDFYLSGKFGRSAPCGEYYSLRGAVKEYRMLTAKPYGPNGEDWPANLLPFEDLLHGYAVYDRDTGLITEWDPDEIAGGDESHAAWLRSFQATGKTLSEYLAR